MPSRTKDTIGELDHRVAEVDDRVARSGCNPEPLTTAAVARGGIDDVGVVASGGFGPDLQAAEPVEEDGDAAKIRVAWCLDLGLVGAYSWRAPSHADVITRRAVYAVELGECCVWETYLDGEDGKEADTDCVSSVYVPVK